MAEVAARMWSLTLRSLTLRDTIPEIDEDQESQSKVEPEFSRQEEAEHLCLSPRPAVEQTKKNSTPLLSRRGSPVPLPFIAEPQSYTKNMIQNLLEETIECIRRTTPVIEFIEFYREYQKAKKRRVGKFHRRRLSEPVSFVKPKDRTIRSNRLSTEGMTPTAQAMSHNLVVPSNMGKSPSLRDIFSLKKNYSTSSFAKPGHFLEHLRTHTPALNEVQRLQQILESRQLNFMNKFVDKGGAFALFSILSGFSRKRQTTPEDINICNVCCACIFALLSACEDNEELSGKMIHAVRSVVATEIPQVDNLSTCANQIANLTTICENNMGHRFVLQEMKQRNDFPLLITLLKTDLSVEGDTRTENIRIKVAVMNMINKLIQNIVDPEDQFRVINTFLNLKLFPMLMELRRMESSELNHTITDFEDFLLTSYFALLPRARRLNNPNPVHSIIINVPTFNITSANMVVPFTPDVTTVFDVVAYAYKQASYLLLFDEKLYGIFKLERDSNPSSPMADQSPTPTPITASLLSTSLKDSQDIDFPAFSLVASGEFADFDESLEETLGSKTKSPRMEKSHKRRSSHANKETVVINPLFGRVNPVLKRTQSQKLASQSQRVLTLSVCENEDDEDDFVKDSKGDWLQGTLKASSIDLRGWEMKLKPWELVISWRKQHVTIQVDPDTTTFSDVTEKILFQIKKQDEGVFEYNLVMHKNISENEGSEVWLEPMKYVNSLQPNVRNLELRTRPIPLNVRSKDSTTHAVMVNDTTTLQSVIKEFGNKLGLQGRHLQDYGLYDKITGEWLESGDILPLLEREKFDLHFLLRPRSICVIYQVADCDLSSLETRRERSSTAYSTLPLYESPSQLHPLSSSSSSSSSFQQSYSSRGITMEPSSFKSEDIMVHFTLCVSQVQIAVCKELGLDNPEEYAMYKETTDTAVVELTPWKSLRNQGVTPNSQVYMLRVAEREETGNDINIWEEPQTDSNLLYENPPLRKNVAAGTLNQLVKVLTSESDHDVFFLETFMLTYRSFTDPRTLLRKLGERYTTPSTLDPATAKTIKAHVGIVLKYWITHEDPAEKDAVLLEELGKFVDSIAEDFSDLASRLEKCIQIERDRMNSPRIEPLAPVLEDPSKSPGITNLNLLELDEYTIACQLALQDSERYSKLKLAEFFNQNWLRNKAPNLLLMVAHFNSISAAVATSIVAERQIKKRVKIVEKHIVIAQCLRKLNDFFSLQAFICAINSSAVNRLKFTMERISSQHAQTLAELEQLMSMENSYKNYRSALREAKPPSVPHIDNYGNLINFSKRSLVSTILMEIESHREIKYTVTGAKKIEQFFNHLPRLSENELYRASLECEPRGATKSSLK